MKSTQLFFALDAPYNRRDFYIAVFSVFSVTYACANLMFWVPPDEEDNRERTLLYRYGVGIAFVWRLC